MDYSYSANGIHVELGLVHELEVSLNMHVLQLQK